MPNHKVTTTMPEAWIVEVDLKATGEQLRSKRRGISLSQECLSELFDRVYDPASRIAISKWENGKKLPSLLHLAFLSKLYDCALDELIVFTYRLSDDGEGDQLVPLIKYSCKANIRFHCGLFAFSYVLGYSLSLGILI